MKLDAPMIVAALRIMFQQGDVFEVRVLDAERVGDRKPHVESGYFEYDHIDDVPKALAEIERAAGVYVTLNPVLPDLLARAANRLKWSKHDALTKDEHIVRRRWLPVDCDPVRPAGISSTTEEKITAWEIGIDIANGLNTLGWSDPVRIDSGNGYHLLYPIDLPANDGGAVHDALKGIALASTDAVKIDTAVANAARIWRLPGTMNCKGDSTGSRPHRMAKMFETPDIIEPIPATIIARANASAEARAVEHGDVRPSKRQGVEYSGDLRPGDDFNARGNIRDALVQHGWQHVGGGDNEQWRRPGKTQGNHSATFDGTTFYVFSSAAPPFEPNKGYTPFATLAMLDYGGDMSKAAQALADCGYGSQSWQASGQPGGEMYHGVDLSALVAAIGGHAVAAKAGGTRKPPVDDPGVVPMELLDVPGFVGDVMKFSLATAPYPSPVLAFAGALCLQAHLAGRKVRDSSDNRTNLYVLALANSGTGKEHPRKVNTRIMHEIGQADSLGGRFVSGEGLQDALVLTPAMMFQTDEIDGMVNSITKSKDARNESIMTALLEVYTSASSIIPVRKKAGAEKALAIDQPCVTMMGSAVPKHYYEALNERMLTNGLFARFMVFEAGARQEGQETEIAEIPATIIERAAWWAKYVPGGGNLSAMHPTPDVVPYSTAAKREVSDLRKQADAAYAVCESKNDPVGMTVWARVGEQARKLALVRAVSRDCVRPQVQADDIEWATRLVIHLARRMLYMASQHVASSPFEADVLRLVAAIRTAGGSMSHSALLRRARCSARDFDAIIATMMQRGEIEPTTESTGGRPGKAYRLTDCEA